MIYGFNNLLVKHKVFVSFYHQDDQWYKDYIDEHLSENIINKSVTDGEYDPDNSDEYIKRLIREDKVSDSSVIVVLVGPNTKHRKHVDWEIYAGLRDSINGSSGLVGIMLPEMRTADDGGWYYADMPGRLADNVRSGYAAVYSWEYAKSHFDEIVDEAFKNRIALKDKKNNSRIQMQKNT
ncbi:TIR domain-containing protein [Oscillospiraceae bacterium 44-5]